MSRSTISFFSIRFRIVSPPRNITIVRDRLAFVPEFGRRSKGAARDAGRILTIFVRAEHDGTEIVKNETDGRDGAAGVLARRQNRPTGRWVRVLSGWMGRTRRIKKCL